MNLRWLRKVGFSTVLMSLLYLVLLILLDLLLPSFFVSELVVQIDRSFSLFFLEGGISDYPALVNMRKKKYCSRSRQLATTHHSWRIYSASLSLLPKSKLPFEQFR